MPSSRYKVQQFFWGFRTYDSYTEEPVDGETGRFSVNLEEAQLIREDRAWLEVVDGELIVHEIVDGEA